MAVQAGKLLHPARLPCQPALLVPTTYPCFIEEDFSKLKCLFYIFLLDIYGLAFVQCDQIGCNSATWATLANFLLNQFSPNQGSSKHGLL